MRPELPVRFEFVPYPIWRRRWPLLLKPVMLSLFSTLYLVEEDRHPPESAVQMADYLLRHRLMPQWSLRELRDLLNEQQPRILPMNDMPTAAPLALPIRIPAQWETAESIVLNWPILYPPLWPLHAAMVEAITPVAEVTLVVPTAMYAQAARLYLAQRGAADLTRVAFIVMPIDDIWVRDHGPIVGYDQTGKRVALNAIYDHLPVYPQQNDNDMPIRWSQAAGVPLYDLNLHTEGGNLLSDGRGTLLMTERLFEENPTRSRQQIETYLHEMLDFSKLIITPYLRMEHTGHIDLSVKLASPTTVFVSAPTTRWGADRLRQTADLLRRETNAAGERYNVVQLPTPELYFNWTYPIRRSYTNALTVNGRVLLPVYQLPTDDIALRLYQEHLPGYEIIPIDCKAGINGGGAVHCLTKEIPA